MINLLMRKDAWAQLPDGATILILDHSRDQPLLIHPAFNLWALRAYDPR